MKKRVVITGIGLICGAADSPESFELSIRKGCSGFSKITDSRLSHLKATHAALVHNLKLSEEDNLLVHNMDRFVHLTIFALRQALNNAKLITPLGSKASLVLGTCSGGMLSVEEITKNRMCKKTDKTKDLYFSTRYYSAAKIAAMLSGAAGPCSTVVTACAAGSGAISHGADLVRAGISDISLVGGADAFAPSTLLGFDALKAVCEGICSPFSENIGLNLGEGAGFLVLESLEHARKRNANIWGEIWGSGLSNDAHHPTAPDSSGKGQAEAMESAIKDAGITAEIIDYINTHGTGTKANDIAECRSISRVFTNQNRIIPTSSTKSMIGHCLGAAGVLEAAATLISTKAGILPPNLGFTVPREGCTGSSFEFVTTNEKQFTGSVSLSNSFGFGGNNACLVMSTKVLSNNVKIETEKPRCVITGIGVLHAQGIDFDSINNSKLLCIDNDTRFSNFPKQTPAALITDFNFKEIDRRLDLKNMDACSKYLISAARLALKDADIPLKPAITSKIGMVTGLSAGPGFFESAHVKSAIENDYKLDKVDSFAFVVQNEASGNAARALLLKGHNNVFSTGWGAGLAALTGATLAIEQGHENTIIASSSDELTERTFKDIQEYEIYGPQTIPGEGAAAFVVESKETALERKANIYAEILGCGSATDINDIRCIKKDAPMSALRKAIESAQIDPFDIRFAAISGTDCQTGYLEEQAIRDICKNAKQVSLSKAIGFPEASLSLISLGKALHLSSPKDLIVALSVSKEGLAYAIIVKREG